MSKESDYPQRESKIKTLRTLLQPERAVTLKPEELKILITAAQEKDPTAIQRLYDGFLLLIFDLVKEEQIYSNLGEDAVNIAWEIFYQLVQSYKGPDYASFPGLVRKVIQGRLFRKLQQQKTKQEPLTSYEQGLEKGQEIVDNTDHIEDLLFQNNCLEALKTLPPKQQLLLYRKFYLDIPLTEQATLQKQSVRTLMRQYKQALDTLRSRCARGPLA